MYDICLEGVSNAGKSFWFHPLKKLYRFYGELDTSNGYQFFYQDCVNKPVIFFEEPNLIPEAAQKFKLVAEDEPTFVSMKNKEDELLQRIPVIITTNNPIWKWCPGEEEALRNRMFYYKLEEPAHFLKDWGEPHPGIYQLLWENKTLSDFNEYCTEPEFPEDDIDELKKNKRITNT